MGFPDFSLSMAGDCQKKARIRAEMPASGPGDGQTVLCHLFVATPGVERPAAVPRQEIASMDAGAASSRALGHGLATADMRPFARTPEHRSRHATIQVWVLMGLRQAIGNF